MSIKALPLLLAAAIGLLAAAQPGEQRPKMHQASGSFDVTLTPVAGAAGDIGGMTITKTFHGDLSGSSQGQMLAVHGKVAGSAGYVAMESVTATLAGRQGSFVLQHSGTMAGGEQALSISVVPASGSGDLAGISGTMAIRIADGKHFYDFAYALPDPR